MRGGDCEADEGATPKIQRVMTIFLVAFGYRVRKCCRLLLRVLFEVGANKLVYVVDHVRPDLTKAVTAECAKSIDSPRRGRSHGDRGIANEAHLLTKFYRNGDGINGRARDFPGTDSHVEEVW